MRLDYQQRRTVLPSAELAAKSVSLCTNGREMLRDNGVPKLPKMKHAANKKLISN
jgi:hypothetical protein